MELLALLLFYITLIGIIASIGLIVYGSIKKEFKYRPKKISMVLIGFLVAFIGSTIFYSIVQSPDSKARYEASQKTKSEANIQKESSEKENKSDDQNQQDKPTKEEVETQTESEIKKDISVETEVKEEVPKPDGIFNIKSEPNTSGAVDEIVLKGKADSKNANKDNIKEAIKFINDNYNKYWAENDIMQKTIYYGAVLQYSNENKDIKKLGEDAVQVVKYVYRKTEKVEDTSTQSNLEQIKKSLDKIPNNLK